MPLLRKKDTLEKISNINTQTYSVIITAFKMPADNLTIEEAMMVGKSIQSIIVSVNNLGKTLAVLDND